MDIFKIKRGLDLRLTGEAKHSVVEAKPSLEYALRPLDFLGITPKVLVKEGQSNGESKVCCTRKWHCDECRARRTSQVAQHSHTTR